ncbi:MAG: hypothetical protein N2645_22855 [Clostridia bacterium]|nr:hypothetical protein [Clostridia bacterium]
MKRKAIAVILMWVILAGCSLENDRLKVMLSKDSSANSQKLSDKTGVDSKDQDDNIIKDDLAFQDLKSSQAKMALKVPSDWKPDNQNGQLFASVFGMGVVGFSEKKDSGKFDSMDSCYYYTMDQIKESFNIVSEEVLKSIKVNGYRARQGQAVVNNEGKSDYTMEYTLLITVVETPEYYHSIRIYCLSDRFQEMKKNLQKIINSFKEV